MGNELRYDKFTERIVIVARERRKRPHLYPEQTFMKEKLECPFCRGHEKETPPAVLLYVIEAGKGLLKTSDADGERRSDWSVRVFPNLYPALTTDMIQLKRDELSVYGYHEVVVENPSHLWRYENAELNAIELPLQVLIERGRFMESDDKIKYVAIFKNQGREAGASITHPHYQIMGCAFVPPLVSKEMASYLKSLDEAGECYFCDLPRSAREGGRLVLSNEYFDVITPFASIFPYECWIIPRRHVGSFLESNGDEIAKLALIFKELFSAYKNHLGNFSFNLIFHSRPVGVSDFHWHLEIYPRLAIHAGFELGSGAYISVMEPEEAAFQLRQARINSDVS